MATSALVCINLKTRVKNDSEDGSAESKDKESSAGPNTQQLVQALVDNGIIQLNHKATIRVIDNSKPDSQDLADFKTLNLGTFAVKQSSDTRSGYLLETVGESESGEQKIVSLVQNRSILVQRNLVLQGPVLSKGTPGLVHLIQDNPPPLTPTPPSTGSLSAQKSKKLVDVDANNGEPIKLPENLESLPKAEHFPTQRHRWNTNEEIAAILICFERHMDWQSKEVKIRPKSGSMLLYSRKKVRYRRDGYCWKKRKDGKTTREDHMKLKVQGTECIYGCYVHSAILPTFHRRCYWLLQNPDIVLVHYLNVPYPDDNKMVSPSLALCADKKQWTKEELISQLKPMFYSEEDAEVKNELEISTAETVESIVAQLLERQRSARTAAICKQLECGCPDSTCADAKTCSQPIRRISAAKPEHSSDSNHVSSTTGSLLTGRNLTHHERTALPLHHLHPSQQIPHGPSGQSGPPVVLSLSQLQSPGSLLILNSSQSTQSASAQIASVVSHRNSSRKEKHHETSMELENNHCQIVQSVPPIAHARVTNHQHQQHHQLQVQQLNNNNAPDKSMEPPKYRRKQHTSLKSATTAPPVKNSYMTPNLKEAGSSEYYETLDLSQEDIQQTLSANMPLSCTQGDGRDSREDNKQSSVLPGLEIDFIDVNASNQVDDDVFVNLDAFDMLSEFPDLEGLDHNHNGNSLGDAVVSESPENNGREGPEADKGGNSPLGMDFREGTANISDYSPEWAYTEGGVKVLVTGPWYSTTSPYTVLFDSCPVPTTLVQSGVLRCYCPAHEAGMVTLQVACEGFVISNAAMFEYKRGPPGTNERATEVGTHESQPHDSLLRFTLMQRLDALDGRFDIKQEPLDSSGDNSTLGGNFEDKLMGCVHRLTQRKWKKREMIDLSTGWCESYKGMTLLHLSAALGYSRLVCSLIQWRTESPSPLLELEVDGLNQDSDGFTPLMRACERGQTETCQLLYEWLPASSTLLNSNNEGVIEVAKKNGHVKLARELQARVDKSNYSILNKNNEGRIHSTTNSLESLNDDSVFLNPNNLNSVNMELHVNIPHWIDNRREISRNSSPSPIEKIKVGERLIKRPSVDSGIQLQSSIDSIPSIRSYRQSKNGDTPKLSRFDRSMSLPLTPPSFDSGYETTLDRLNSRDFMLCESDHQSPSPSSTSTNGGQPPAVDDLRVQLHQPQRTTETDQSGGGDPVGVGGNGSNGVVNGDQPDSEQEVRVLTLAEQIIAAMPERIKNESEGEMMMTSSDEMEVMSLESPLLLDEPASSSSSCCFDTSSEFNFDQSYRYYDVGTPCSSLSPASCLSSPPFDLHRSPSPPPTTADFCEFLHASNSTYFEKDFSNLTLSDREQRELYEAAKVIQKAYRSYKGRKKLEQDKERRAAILIQNYYRRYKQYAYFKQMTKAAMVIQNGFRSYCENKRFKKNQEAAVRIQNCYRNYRDQTDLSTTSLKRTYSQRRQHQAARKIQQFMRQSKNNLWDIGPGTIITERASRKREAGPMQGVPSKLAVLPFHITNKQHSCEPSF